MHLGPGRAPRPARPPPHDSGTTLRRDDALSRGHPVPGRRRGPGTTGSGAADSCDSAAVIPVAIDGMQAVLPIGRYLPRIFKRIAVSFGSPVDYTDLLAMPRTRETAQAVIDRVMAAIRVQTAELRRRRSTL